MHYFVTFLVLKSSWRGRESWLLSFKLSSWFPVNVSVLWPFLTVPLVGLQDVVVVFPNHTYLLLDNYMQKEKCNLKGNMANDKFEVWHFWEITIIMSSPFKINNKALLDTVFFGLFASTFKVYRYHSFYRVCCISITVLFTHMVDLQVPTASLILDFV